MSDSAADVSSWTVHNHGPEQGPGIACREYRVNGRLLGSCLLPAQPLTPGLDVERLRAVVKAAYLFVRYRAGEVRIYDEYWYDLTDALREIPLSIYGDATPESGAAYDEADREAGDGD